MAQTTDMVTYFNDLLTFIDLKLAAYHEATKDYQEASQLGWIEKKLTDNAVAFERDADEKLSKLLNHSITFNPLDHVINTFGLCKIDRLILMLSLSLELDNSFSKSFYYLNPINASEFPTLGLALRVFSNDFNQYLEFRTNLNLHSKLFKYFYIDSVSKHSSVPLSQLPLKLDASIVDFIIDFEHYEFKHPVLSLLMPNSSDHAFSDAEKVLKLSNFIKSHHLKSPEDHLIFMCHGPSGVGKHHTVFTLCDQFNLPAILVNCKALSQNLVETSVITREAMLHRALLIFDHFEVLLDLLNDPLTANTMVDFIGAIHRFSKIAFAISHKPWHPPSALSRFAIIDLPFDVPSREARLKLWEHHLACIDLEEDVSLQTIANTFKFSAEQIIKAVQTAENLKLWENTALVSQKLLSEACYLQTDAKLTRLSSRLKTHYSWDDLILPNEPMRQLREASNQISYKHVVYDHWGFGDKITYGTGLGLLFTGPPGTGKTLSAQVIANMLGLELYRVDLSQIISKYIGETEKNLKEIFDEAEKSHAILLFDEGDALFSKRTEVGDAKDKYANVETSYLLQKIEAYPGISVVTTNIIANIDEAFIRRFSYVIHFPFPKPEERFKIWQHIFPKGAPLSPEIDFEFLSKQFELSGGNIKNIALNASFLAASKSRDIQMKDLIHSIATELSKTGQSILPNDFGAYAYMLG